MILITLNYSGDLHCLEILDDFEVKSVHYFSLAHTIPQTDPLRMNEGLHMYVLNHKKDEIEPTKVLGYYLILFSDKCFRIGFTYKVDEYYLYCFDVSYIFMKIVFAVSDSNIL